MENPMKTLPLILALGMVACAAETADAPDVGYVAESIRAGHDGIPDVSCTSMGLAQQYHDEVIKHFKSCGNLVYSTTIPGEAGFWCEDVNVDYSFRLYSFFGGALWNSNPPKDAGFTIQAYRGIPGTTLKYWGGFPTGYCNCASDVLCRTPGISYSR
jgi:hypothetical protein